MPTEEFADFLYAACLQDWDAERERMQRFADRFDAADEVRIVADGTDIRLSIAGRSMKVDAGGANIPGGEFFGCPIEDSAEGVIAFTEFPAVYAGREVNGIRLRFEAGAVVDASADTNEAYLMEMLDSDSGARRLGELGIGCNPGITRHMKNILFDQNIDGTVHLALGKGMPDLGGKVIDTAPAYGQSEVVLGNLLAELGSRDRFFLATKVTPPDGNAGSGRAMLEDSFRRLRTPRIDLMQVHNLDGVDVLMPVLREAKQAERIRYLGVTTSRAEQYPQLLDAMRRHKLDFIQVDYSIDNRAAADKVLPLDLIPSEIRRAALAHA